MNIETPAEACAALAVMMVAADDLGSDEERQFLHETVAALPIFKDLSGPEFMALIADMTASLYSSLPVSGGRLSSEGVGQLVEMICAALPAEQRVEALEAAVGLAKSDGVVSGEALLLQRLCEGLEIGEDAKARLLGGLT